MEDELINNWNNQDNALVPKPTAPIAPGVAEAAANVGDRWGVDNPMFDSPEDMHGFLQGVGMAPGGLPADILDSMLYMSEGQFADAIVSMGAATPVLGNLIAPMRYGGKVQRGKRFKKELQKRFDEYETVQASQRQSNKELLDVRDTIRAHERIDKKINKGMFGSTHTMNAPKTFQEQARKYATESGNTYKHNPNLRGLPSEKEWKRGQKVEWKRGQKEFTDMWGRKHPAGRRLDPGDYDLDK
jgi:hypothetical protein